MQRIPAMDVFGTPKGVGYLPPRVLGQAGAAPKLETALRFEILDAEGNYVPGVAVSLVTEKGTHLITPAMSDAGGNVAVSAGDLLREAQEAVKLSPTIQKQKIYALVEGQGYEPVRILIFDPASGQTMDQVKRLHEVTLDKAAEGSSFGSPGVIGLGLIAGVLLGAVYLFTNE